MSLSDTNQFSQSLGGLRGNRYVYEETELDALLGIFKINYQLPPPTFHLLTTIYQPKWVVSSVKYASRLAYLREKLNLGLQRLFGGGFCRRPYFWN